MAYKVFLFSLKDKIMNSEIFRKYYFVVILFTIGLTVVITLFQRPEVILFSGDQDYEDDKTISN